jgi:hypothetical protein
MLMLDEVLLKHTAVGFIFAVFAFPHAVTFLDDRYTCFIVASVLVGSARAKK